MTEGDFDGSSGSARSSEVSADDDRGFLTIERRMKIVKTINMHKTATVAEIAEWVGASPATVRRDLAWLDEQGLITRTRGGATAIDYPSQATLRRTIPTYEQRMNEYIEEKRSIGQCAAEHIHDGETIILDASTTNHYVLPFLAKKRDLTVITNSLYISKELMTIGETNPSLTVICSGGTLFMTLLGNFVEMSGQEENDPFISNKRSERSMRSQNQGPHQEGNGSRTASHAVHTPPRDAFFFLFSCPYKFSQQSHLCAPIRLLA